EHCKQPAAVHITEARENAATGEHHLCEECARTYMDEQEADPIDDRRPAGPHNEDGEFRLDVVRLVISEVADTQVVVFREVGGRRSFELVIGIFEATTIDRKLKRIPTPRPL